MGSSALAGIPSKKSTIEDAIYNLTLPSASRAENTLARILQQKIDESIQKEPLINEKNEKGFRKIVEGPQECGGTMMANRNPFVKQARPITKEEKEADEEESDDKMQTTEQRLESDEVNGGERIHKDKNEKNQNKRTNVHAKDDERIDKKAGCNACEESNLKKKKSKEPFHHV